MRFRAVSAGKPDGAATGLFSGGFLLACFFVDRLSTEVVPRARAGLRPHELSDLRSQGSKKRSEVSLKVFDPDAKSHGEFLGAKGLKKLYSLLGKAKSEGTRKLGKPTPKRALLLGGLAYRDHQVEWMSFNIICPDCGHEHQDVLATMQQMKLRGSHLVRALEKVQGLYPPAHR